MKRVSGAFVGVAMLLLLVGGSGDARAQSFMNGDDPMIYLPQMMMIIDTSCSMNWGDYNGRTPIQAAREVLIGVPTCPDDSELGILDAYDDLVHFGYATFDSSGTHNDYPPGGDGMGYYGIKRRDCGGGSLIDLVKADDPLDLVGHSVEISNSACSMIASGGTPLGPALWDARLYWTNWRDEIDVPDPMDKCYPKFTVLMSDGHGNTGEAAYGTGIPNAFALWDLDIFNPGVARLFSPWYAAKTKGIPTFAVGFGYAGMDAIALAGSGGLLLSYFANDPAELYDAFAMILAAILSGESSRTGMLSSPARGSSD